MTGLRSWLSVALARRPGRGDGEIVAASTLDANRPRPWLSHGLRAALRSPQPWEGHGCHYSRDARDRICSQPAEWDESESALRLLERKKKNADDGASEKWMTGNERHVLSGRRANGSGRKRKKGASARGQPGQAAASTSVSGVVFVPVPRRRRQGPVSDHRGCVRSPLKATVIMTGQLWPVVHARTPLTCSAADKLEGRACDSYTGTRRGREKKRRNEREGKGQGSSAVKGQNRRARPNANVLVRPPPEPGRAGLAGRAGAGWRWLG